MKNIKEFWVDKTQNEVEGVVECIHCNKETEFTIDGLDFETLKKYIRGLKE